MRARIARFTAVLQAVLLMATLILPALAAAAEIQTDLWIYQYGDTVTVTGVDFGADETVDLVSTDPNGVEVDRGTAQSDVQGAFTYQFVLLSDVPGIYDVVATGLSSGASAATQFDPTNVSISNAAFAWNAGAFTVSLSGTYTCSTGGAACTDPDDVTVDVFLSNGSNNSVSGAAVLTKVLVVSVTGSNQAWSTTLSFPGDAAIPADGKYDIRAVFHGKNGTTPVSATPAFADERFGVDTTSPSSSVTTVSGGPTVVTAGGSASDPGASASPATGSGLPGGQPVRVEIRTASCSGPTVPGTAVDRPVGGTGSWTYTSPVGSVPTAAGTYYVVSIATDVAGNVQGTPGCQSYSLVDAAPTVVSTSPADSETGVGLSASISLTFSEPVNVSFITVSCAASGLHTFTASGNGTSIVTFAPAQPYFAGEVCTVTVTASAVADVDAIDPPNNMAANYSFSFTTFSPNTAPTVSVTGVVDAGSYNKGSVPAATCDVVDVEDGNSSFPATLSPISGTDAAFGIGSQTASCEYTDGGGLTANDDATYDITDGTGPEISYVLTPTTPGGDNDWFVGTVTLVWTVTEGDSPSTLSKVGCVDQTLTDDQASTDYSCSATSSGGSAGPVTVSIKIDATAPSASVAIDDSPNGAGWFNSTVSFTTSGLDNLSGVASCTDAADYSGPDADPATSASATCTDNAGNVSDPAFSNSFKYDATAPSITDTGAATSPNSNGWYKTDVVNGFSVDADISGPDAACAAAFPGGSQTKTTSGEGLAVGVTSDGCTDNAGNTATGEASADFQVDKTAPSVSLVGGPANGGSYYFGSVPATPTCSASDGLSGLDGSCGISGYGTTVGSHTVTASATDKAGNTATASASYDVLAWTLSGFYSPVDMGGVLNTVKAGSTVPLKFEVFAGPTELTLTSYIQSFRAQEISCSNFGALPVDDIEVTSTGGTQLRYDSTGGQFIQNWQTAKNKAGACYAVTMTTLDGSTLTALFKLK
jgi:hypothetical protein